MLEKEERRKKLEERYCVKNIENKLSGYISFIVERKRELSSIMHVLI